MTLLLLQSVNQNEKHHLDHAGGKSVLMFDSFLHGMDLTCKIFLRDGTWCFKNLPIEFQGNSECRSRNMYSYKTRLYRLKIIFDTKFTEIMFRRTKLRPLAISKIKQTDYYLLNTNIREYGDAGIRRIIRNCLFVYIFHKY